MEATNRRGFLRQAGLGVAAAGAVAAVPKLFSPASAAGMTPVAESTPAALEGPMVAYLRDAKSGEFSLMVGEREVTYVNKTLAAQLSHAAK